jgi:pilus assembly protein CpaC
MNSGQTFMMAGLIDRETQARASKVPGLGDLPILGTLFRSVRYEQDDTDLVMLVTASLVEPDSITGTPPAPGFLHSAPNDWELFLNGSIEGKDAKVSAMDAERLREAGLNRLRGPGAWATYEDSSDPHSTSDAVPPAK